MENLKQLLEALLEAELIHDRGEMIDFSHWIGEENTWNASMKKMIRKAGLSEHEKSLKSLNRSGAIKIVPDDGWFHVNVSRELMDESFISSLEID